MPNLTKEYFTQQLKGLEGRSRAHTDKEISSVKTHIGEGISAVKAHTEQEVANLARMVSNRFDTIERVLDVREKVEKLERQMREVRQAIGYSK